MTIAIGDGNSYCGVLKIRRAGSKDKLIAG
jgi:hypothetical protein